MYVKLSCMCAFATAPSCMTCSCQNNRLHNDISGNALFPVKVIIFVSIQMTATDQKLTMEARIFQGGRPNLVVSYTLGAEPVNVPNNFLYTFYGDCWLLHSPK